MSKRWMDGRQINNASRNIKEIENQLGHKIPSGMYFDVSTEWMTFGDVCTTVRNIKEVESQLGLDKPKRDMMTFAGKPVKCMPLSYVGVIAGVILIGISIFNAIF